MMVVVVICIYTVVVVILYYNFSCYFFLKYTSTTEIYPYRHTLSPHDALPFSVELPRPDFDSARGEARLKALFGIATLDGFGSFSRAALAAAGGLRSEEHTSELQSLMRISYAVFCLKKKKYQM